MQAVDANIMNLICIFCVQVVSMQRQRRSHLGLLLLASQVFQVGVDHIPPVTLAVLGLNVYLFLFPAAHLLKVTPLTCSYSRLETNRRS